LPERITGRGISPEEVSGGYREGNAASVIAFLGHTAAKTAERLGMPAEASRGRDSLFCAAESWAVENGLGTAQGGLARALETATAV
jgi:hypothetical protein